jgi:SAM-dependent methyltransferase
MEIEGTKPGVNQRVKELLRAALPLAVRKRLAVWIGGQTWLPPRDWWSLEILRDLAERDADEYHRFLWRHHLAYAQTYEISERFGAENVHPTRRLFFADLTAQLAAGGADPGTQVASVLEVGCSMGYLLRFLETSVFGSADVLHGVDIDRYAIDQGTAYLREQGSKVQLRAGDIVDLDRILDGRTFDVVLCLGVLMYLTEDAATAVVEAMLRAATGLVAISGVAHPSMDNAQLERSEPRAWDSSWIHNIDAMVRKAGGNVRYRRWDGARVVDGNTIYFVFCTPAARTEATGKSGRGVLAAR